MSLFRIVTDRIEKDYADKIICDVTSVFQDIHIFDTISDDRIKNLEQSISNGKENGIPKEELLKYLHNNYFNSVLCLTSSAVIDENKAFIRGYSEQSTFRNHGHIFVSAYLSEFKDEDGHLLHKLVSKVAVHELGHYFGLDDHNVQDGIIYTPQTCIMTQSEITKPLAERKKELEIRGTSFCDYCIERLY